MNAVEIIGEAAPALHRIILTLVSSVVAGSVPATSSYIGPKSSEEGCSKVGVLDCIIGAPYNEVRVGYIEYLSTRDYIGARVWPL